jgi:hypothetical protein
MTVIAKIAKLFFFLTFKLPRKIQELFFKANKRVCRKSREQEKVKPFRVRDVFTGFIYNLIYTITYLLKARKISYTD